MACDVHVCNEAFTRSNDLQKHKVFILVISDVRCLAKPLVASLATDILIHLGEH